MKPTESIARIVVAAVLLAAATLKAAQLVTEHAPGVHFRRWVELMVVEYELLLAVWIVSGRGWKWARRVVMSTFVLFGGYSFYLGVSGAQECGCFGAVRVSPWWTFGLDASLAIVIVLWQPRHQRRVFKGEWSSCVLDRVLVMVGVVALAMTLLVAAAVSGSWLSASGLLKWGQRENGLVVLEPETWIGQRFPLLDDIHPDLSQMLSRGSWKVVFFRWSCAKCQDALPGYRTLAVKLRDSKQSLRVVLVEVPPYEPHLATPMAPCLVAQLTKGKQWLIHTPAAVLLRDGRVTGVTDGETQERP